MQHRIALKKITFFHHLMNLPHNSLAYQVASSQARLGYPGLVAECEQIMETYQIKGNPVEFSKVHWKNICKKKIFEKNRSDILEKSKSYTKVSYETLREEKFETKSYLKEMTLSDARMKFSLRARMTRTIQTNFRGDPSYTRNKWRCVGCGQLDAQEHLVVCAAYANLRNGKDLKVDADLVQYFREVINVREAC